MPSVTHPNHLLISSEDVEGTKVYDHADKNIGELHHLMINKESGRVVYAVISFGEFFGLGHGQYPVPWSALRYDHLIVGFRTNISKQDLKDAPAFTDESWGDRVWEKRTHQHYHAPLHW
jgi:sporulation protein YlmC with PRC-barrel domain